MLESCSNVSHLLDTHNYVWSAKVGDCVLGSCSRDASEVFAAAPAIIRIDLFSVTAAATFFRFRRFFQVHKRVVSIETLNSRIVNSPSSAQKFSYNNFCVVPRIGWLWQRSRVEFQGKRKLSRAELQTQILQRWFEPTTTTPGTRKEAIAAFAVFALVVAELAGFSKKREKTRRVPWLPL